MVVLPPGTILQLMYLAERLRGMAPGRFIEIGPGSGEITARLLAGGWQGTVYDLSAETVRAIEDRFALPVEQGRLKAFVKDFSQLRPGPNEQGADLVISSMVMEHMDGAAEERFMRVAAEQLAEGGRMVAIVPASPSHWGIEDEIAGHYRRYDRAALERLLGKSGWRLLHIAGLTYPLSNLLLPLSNHLVRRKERDKLWLPMEERTLQSGHRQVPFKTSFPPLLACMLNESTMRPFHWLQKALSASPNALVMYFEAAPN